MERNKRVIAKMLCQGVPDKVLQALKRFEVDERLLENLNQETQIVTDLGIWGDDFSEFYEILSEIYGTEFLVPAKCVPSEFAWAGIIKGWLPFADMKKAVPVSSLTVTELDEIMRGLASEA